ncbi:MAG: hypothetical protein GY942_02505 [Aestuariibacter sp.]|nr:hypothetical protein [Aestuariibacter sp.]
MTTEYELSSIKDVFDNVPTDKVDICLAELAAGIKQAQTVRDVLKDFAGAVTGDREHSQALWPETCTWIDDDKGEITINTTIEVQQPTT